MENAIWFIVKNLSKTFIYFVCHLFCMQTVHLHMEESVGRLVDSVKEKCINRIIMEGVTADNLRIFWG